MGFLLNWTELKWKLVLVLYFAFLGIISKSLSNDDIYKAFPKISFHFYIKNTEYVQNYHSCLCSPSFILKICYSREVWFYVWHISKVQLYLIYLYFKYMLVCIWSGHEKINLLIKYPYTVRLQTWLEDYWYWMPTLKCRENRKKWANCFSLPNRVWGWGVLPYTVHYWFISHHEVRY